LSAIFKIQRGAVLYRVLINGAQIRHASRRSKATG